MNEPPERDGKKDYSVTLQQNSAAIELGNVTRPAIVERMLGMLNKVDKHLASGITKGLGMKVPGSVEGRVNQAVGADAGKETESKPMKNTYGTSPALSMMNTVKDTIREG